MSLKSQPAYAENFKKAIQTAEQKKEKSLFVFDMDSTLFCMKYRTQAIIKDCLKDSLFCEQFPEHLNTIRQVEVTERDWSVEEIMSRYGFSRDESFVQAIQKIWKKSFFTNNYLHLDKPYNGCVSFVRHIFQSGAKVYYLTARNRATMYEGTVLSLKFWNFPLENEEHLIMKKQTKMEDAFYKTEHLKKLTQKSDTILFFENEPVILNKVAQTIPQIHLFWMNSTHSRREEPPQNALTIIANYVWQ